MATTTKPKPPGKGKSKTSASSAKQLNVLLPPWMITQLRRTAKAEDRSSSAIVRIALRRYFAAADESAERAQNRG